MSSKVTPVKVGIMKTIYEAMLPAKYRLDSILRDQHDGSISLSQAELTALLEFTSAAYTLELMFEDYFEQASEAGVDVLELPNREFTLLLDLSKTVEISLRSPIALSGLWTH